MADELGRDSPPMTPVTPAMSLESPAVLPPDSPASSVDIPASSAKPPPSLPFGFSPSFSMFDDSDKADASSSLRNRRRSRYAPQALEAMLPPISTSKTQATTLEPSTNDGLPLLSPGAQQRFLPTPDKPYLPGQPKSLEGIAIRSFCLGIALALSVVTMLSILILTSSPLWRLPFFIGALSTFHFLEFWTTAKYNTSVATVGSFLLTANWPAYAIAHVSGSLECILTTLLFPNRSWAPYYSGHILLLLGFILVFVGQAARSAAMVQAGSSFNHTIQSRRKADHELVTTGLYSFLRHPAYFGFFYWGIGTQLVLGNPICCVAYTVVLWSFFSDRIKSEERLLIKFFGEDYIDYKKRVGTGLPFIGR
ncbi:ICMT-domain-containing protein [Xylariaceae sp. FL0255]|nr:ICMT-domain-containing protein [Xylariaceae sp. FL0255]